MKAKLLKISDYMLFFGTGLIIIYIIAHSFNHVGIIKNLPGNIHPAEKKTIYDTLMNSNPILTQTRTKK